MASLRVPKPLQLSAEAESRSARALVRTGNATVADDRDGYRELGQIIATETLAHDLREPIKVDRILRVVLVDGNVARLRGGIGRIGTGKDKLDQVTVQTGTFENVKGRVHVQMPVVDDRHVASVRPHQGCKVTNRIHALAGLGNRRRITQIRLDNLDSQTIQLPTARIAWQHDRPNAVTARKESSTEISTDPTGRAGHQ